MLDFCPFCCGRAEIIEENDGEHNKFSVRCTECGCTLMCSGETRDEAIEEWNWRVC